jgi:hypothetical protein
MREFNCQGFENKLNYLFKINMAVSAWQSNPRKRQFSQSGKSMAAYGVQCRMLWKGRQKI